jgi:thioredoxin reductase
MAQVKFKMFQQIYDCLIIGGGPSGLAVASGLARLQHTALVIDSGQYRNDRAAHMHNVLGWDHQNAAELRAKARQDLLTRYSTIQFQSANIRRVWKANLAMFYAEDEDGNVVRGKKLCLAVGVKDIMPAITGYSDCWARGMYVALIIALRSY